MWLPNTFAILGVAREQDPEQEIKDMGLHLNSWSLLRDMRAAILKEGKKKKKNGQEWWTERGEEHGSLWQSSNPRGRPRLGLSYFGGQPWESPPCSPNYKEQGWDVKENK